MSFVLLRTIPASVLNPSELVSEIFDALGTSFLPYHDENANCYITKETEEKFEEIDRVSTETAN